MINIKDFGAAETNDDNAAYIQKAIDNAEKGDTVFIPAGIFLCSTIYLKSNITLYFGDGAVLKATTDIARYKNIYNVENGKPFVDSFGMGINSFIICSNAENVTFEGNGIIDLSGNDMLDYSITDEDVKKFGDKVNQIPARPNERIRRPIFFDKCTNIRVKNIKVINSPCWTFTFNNCRDLKVLGITVENNVRTPHSDGVHISGSTDAIIDNCNFTCGDDCIALTSLMDDTKVCKNIIISNCIMQSSSAAIRIGHISGKVESVIVSNICIHNTNRGIAVFAGDGGFVKNVSIANVIMDTYIPAGGWWGKGEPFVICSANSSGLIENVKIVNMNATSENIGLVAGNVENFELCDSKINIIDGENRIYAKEFDIAPNGKLLKQNDFCGEYYLEK